MSDDNATNETPEPSVLDQILGNEELVAQLKEKLAPVAEPENDKVKENISKAYAQRDEMQKELEDLRQAKREAELKALEEAGKKEEADKMRMDELAAQLKAAKDQVTGLTRDTALKGSLAALDFRSEKAAAVAYQDIVGTLIQDASGNWVSPTGQSIADYVQFYSQDDSNSFLFNVKQSSGSSAMSAATQGTSKPVSGNEIDPRKMSAMDYARAIEEGKVETKGTWY